ncbi:hypothetical protein GZ22_05790 [Terribacillus saccharophilus]|uniref:Uncharacterized protein n=1 Tax=Terribacillus saccharophilus TaxID=361277 RepID=A0A075LP29_9BACI|nr:hypothetical protein [Terribacillus goriensis]AIF66178.1 hypothetical protein GZ22_05790 [Terribacillus goriensis]
MLMAEFIEKIQESNLNLGEFQIELDKISDEPYIIGCFFNGKVWTVYKTRERLGHYIINEYKNESDAFHYLYDLVLEQHRRTIRMEA